MLCKSHFNTHRSLSGEGRPAVPRLANEIRPEECRGCRFADENHCYPWVEFKSDSGSTIYRFCRKDVEAILTKQETFQIPLPVKMRYEEV